MKKLLSIVAAMLLVMSLSAQKVDTKVNVVHNHEHVRIASMQDHLVSDGGFAAMKNGEINPRRRPNGAYGKDPKIQVEKIRQETTGYRNSIIPILNINGVTNTSNPPDPSIAVGPDHFIQMVNTSIDISDKDGNSYPGYPTSLASFFPNAGNSGDPITLYDEMSDRFFVSEFGNGNALAVGLSETGDPLGAWNFWTFTTASFPDYPKYNVWSDGYYTTGNFGSNNVYIMDRVAMLNGDPSITSIELSLISQGTSGFRTALPVDHDGSAIPTRRAMIIGANDSNWGGGQPTDHLRIWNLVPDWVTPNNSFLEIETTLNTSPFDAIFPGSGFCNIEQPTGQDLDAIGDGLMNPATYRDFGTHESLVCCHSVDVDGQGTSGIRWYELRDEGIGWFIYQEGTYAPADDESRWMGSIGIDKFGNMSVAYSVSSGSTFPSLRFTGRFANDPLGEMTIEECFLKDGTSSINAGGCRFGDYSHMVTDPADGVTFWFTGEYGGNSHDTRIGAWQIGSILPDDVGVSSIDTPTDGLLSAAEDVTVTINNYGTEDQTGFEVSYVLDAGTPVTETYSGTLVSNTSESFTFATQANMGAFGIYDIVSYTSLVGDGFAQNDTSQVTVVHFPPNDVGVSAIISPVSDQLLTTMETLTVTVSNFGSMDQTSFDVSCEFDGNPAFTETITTNVAALQSTDFVFTTNTVDMEAVGPHSFKIYTSLAGDSDNTNDTLETDIETLDPIYCAGEANCNEFGDAILQVVLNDLNNTSGCGANGYSNFTNITATIDLGEIYAFGVMEEFDDHFASMWIDFDQNFMFTEDERIVDALSLSTANNLVSEDIVLDGSYPLGTFIMRVKSEWSGNGAPISTDPCADIEYGETEDYTVVVEDIIDNTIEIKDSFNLNTYLNESGNLIVAVNGNVGDYSVKVLDATGRLLKKDSFINSNGIERFEMETQYLVSGSYIVLVTNEYTRLTNKFVMLR